jgi:hypothetical protein
MDKTVTALIGAAALAAGTSGAAAHATYRMVVPVATCYADLLTPVAVERVRVVSEERAVEGETALVQPVDYHHHYRRHYHHRRAYHHHHHQQDT